MKKTKESVPTVRMTLNTGETCEFTYSSLELAQQHAQVLKAASTFMGKWITKIEVL
jgi:hypothetical protein